MTALWPEPFSLLDDGLHAGRRAAQMASAIARRDQSFGTPNDAESRIAGHAFHQGAAKSCSVSASAYEASVRSPCRLDRFCYGARAVGGWVSGNQHHPVTGAAFLPEGRVAPPTSSRAQQRLDAATKRTIAPTTPVDDRDVAPRSIRSDWARTVAGRRLDLSAERDERRIGDLGFLSTCWRLPSPGAVTVPVSGSTADGLERPGPCRVPWPRFVPARGTHIPERRRMPPTPCTGRRSALADAMATPITSAPEAAPFPSAEGPRALLRAARVLSIRTRGHGPDLYLEAGPVPSRVARPGRLRPPEPCR